MTPERDNTSGAGSSAPTDWKQAITTLIGSRIEIIQLEMSQALRAGSRTLVALAAGLFCAFFTWVLLLAGGIAAIAQATQWPWHYIALVLAGVHLLAAIVLLRAAKSPKAPPFTVTRSEFQKDCEWIKSLQNKAGSEN